MKNFLILLFIISPFFLNAQNTIYFMEGMPQKRAYNPAIIPKVKFYLGLPGLGGASLNAYNSGFNLDGLTDFIDNLEREAYNPDKFIHSIGDFNRFDAQAEINLFSLGFKLEEKGYFSLSLTSNGVIDMRADSKVAYLLADYDNISSDKFPIIVDDVDFSANSYLDLGISYTRKINPHLTLGITPHILFSGIGVKTNKLQYVVETEETTGSYNEYESTFNGEAIIGLPIEINPDAIAGDEFDLDQGMLAENWMEDITAGDITGNKSFVLDVGATYELEKWIFSASILNIGNSGWKTNAYRLNGNNESIKIKNEGKIKIGVPSSIYLGAARQFSDRWNYGILFKNTFYNTGSRPAATLSLNGYVGSMLSTSISYTAGYKFDNLGLGMRLRFFPGLDFFVVSDNILQAFSYKKGYRFTASVGINMALGLKKEYQQINI